MEADGIAHAFKGADLYSKFGMNSAFLETVHEHLSSQELNKY